VRVHGAQPNPTTGLSIQETVKFIEFERFL
jgi:hypothetical protein